MSKILENENKLLLLCSRTQVDAAEQKQITTLARSDLDWDALVKMAFHHKTWPLLYRNLSSICPDAVPGNIRKKLKKHYVNNSIWNMERLRLLQEITLLFDQHNIDFLTVKGPLLTLQYFGDIAYRYFGDLDILVRKRDLKKANDIIRNLGFDFSPEGLSGKYHHWFAEMSHHGNLDNGRGLHVEVHWELSGHYRGLLWTYEELESFIETVPLPGGSGRFQTLKAEMMILYLALHGQRHYWKKYDYSVCLVECLEKSYVVDKEDVANLVAKYHLQEVMILAIGLSNQLLRLSYDIDLLITDKEKVLCKRQIDRYCEYFHQMNNEISQLAVGQGEVFVTPEELRFVGNRWGKGCLPHLFRRYFVPQIADWESAPLPYRLRWFFYVIRPIKRIFFKMFPSYAGNSLLED